MDPAFGVPKSSDATLCGPDLLVSERMHVKSEGNLLSLLRSPWSMKHAPHSFPIRCLPSEAAVTASALLVGRQGLGRSQLADQNCVLRGFERIMGTLHAGCTGLTTSCRLVPGRHLIGNGGMRFQGLDWVGRLEP
jgi:hypothetical protein